MMKRRMLLLAGILASVCACIGQNGIPPLPADVLGVDATLDITAQDAATNDVTMDYTLFLTNNGDTALEKVILKDFILPGDIVMEKDYFEIDNLKPGERKSVTFTVVAKRWSGQDQIWEVDFTIRIEKGNAYTEQDVFYYQIHLTPG
ncbi:MAG: hypothetical protein HXS40_04505 [Theionarchaea archaeon]|nr:hypothetical protein [Theionarchaea archaeon]